MKKNHNLEHPQVTAAVRGGYPYDPGEEEFDEDAYQAYCDYLYDQKRERELFGE